MYFFKYETQIQYLIWLIVWIVFCRFHVSGSSGSLSESRGLDGVLDGTFLALSRLSATRRKSFARPWIAVLKKSQSRFRVAAI